MSYYENAYTPARLDEVPENKNQFADLDPFTKSWDDIKGLSGMNTNFKRRSARMAKALGDDAYLESAGAIQTGINGARSTAINPGIVFRNAYSLFDVITPPYNLYELASYYDTSFANHAAIDAKVENTVGLGYDFIISDKTSLKLEAASADQMARARKRIEKLKVQLRDWLEGLNQDESFTSVLEKVFTDVHAMGNGYIEVGRTVTGEIGYVGHIPASTMRVRRLRDGYVQIIANKVVYFRNFGAKNVNYITDDPRPNEIIHIKEYSPLNTFYGVPDVLAAMPSLVGDMLASQYNIDYFNNKAVPRYIVTLKGAQLTQEAEDKLFRFLQTGLKGQSHRTLYIPLPGDSETNKVEFKMEPIENGVQEGSFTKYREQNRDDILVAHQVPLSKLGGSSSSTIADSLAQDRTFKEQVARPAQRNLEKILNKIIREKTDILEFKFNELTLTDELAQSQILTNYVKNQIMVPNEARELLNLPEREESDSMIQPTARQAADSNANNAKDRTRDGERQQAQADNTATTQGRNPKGEGRRSS
ncbi:MAG: phage portal protein [Actinobacteria bacterium]|nr:phage portal protein [Actinomycetota bacterium]